MQCPFCQASDTKVIDSRTHEAFQIRRRRACIRCEYRFNTFEKVELSLPKIIKRDGRREAFNEANLRSGMLIALKKRPVSMDSVEKAISDIKTHLLGLGKREIDSKILGEYVINTLKKLDEIAYVRFASVYRQFQDISEFHEAISKIQEHVNIVDMDQ